MNYGWHRGQRSVPEQARHRRRTLRPRDDVPSRVARADPSPHRRFERRARPRMGAVRALSRTIGGDVLWSPANTGPLLARRHVITIHDISPIEHPEWFDAGFVAWYRCLIPQLVRRATRVVTVSQFSKSRILERLHVSDDRIVVIPNGVDRRFRPGARTACDRTDASAAPALGLTGPFILTVGSLSPRKNLGRLFSAWQLSGLGRKGCVLAVAGVQCASFKRVDLRTPPVGVRLLGYVPDAELPALYGRALGVVVPSLYEGFGLLALEAMACGTPVIAARAGGLPETVADAALLVDPLAPEALSDALRRVFEDRALRAQLARRGVDRSRRFSWRLAADQLWGVLDDAQRA